MNYLKYFSVEKPQKAGQLSGHIQLPWQLSGPIQMTLPDFQI